MAALESTSEEAQEVARVLAERYAESGIERVDQLNALAEQLTGLKCRDGNDVVETDTIISPSGKPPPYVRCRHGSPHCYDLSFDRLPECP